MPRSGNLNGEIIIWFQFISEISPKGLKLKQEIESFADIT